MLTASDCNDSGKDNQAGWNVRADLRELFPAIDRGDFRDLHFTGPDQVPWIWRYLSRPRRTEYRLTAPANADLSQNDKKNISPRKFREHYQLASGDVLEFEKLSEDEFLIHIAESASANENKNTTQTAVSGVRFERFSCEFQENPYITRPWAYIARYGSTDLYRIGITGLLQRCQKELNRHLPAEELSLESWSVRYVKQFQSDEDCLEQIRSLLDELAPEGTKNERFQRNSSTVGQVIEQHGFEVYRAGERS